MVSGLDSAHIKALQVARTCGYPYPTNVHSPGWDTKHKKTLKESLPQGTFEPLIQNYVNFPPI